MSLVQRLALIALLFVGGSEMGWLPPIGGGVFSQKVELIDPWFVIVEESSERTGAVAGIIADAALWEEAKSIGIQYRVYDKDLPDAAPYRATADAAGLPAYLFISNDKLLRSGRLPESRDDVRRILRQE